VQYFNLIAECYHKLGIYDSSWSYYDKALKLDEENILINNNYAYYLAEENVELKKALKMSEKTIKSEPENPTYLDTYAWILFKMNRIRKARKVIEKAIEYGGNDDPDILDHYGEILFRLGKYKESVTIWNRILELDQERKEEISKKIIRARELVK
ncbi:MAG: hypothetical protein JXB24_03605, partial [Bacteroidales bacterium]|nr:hypothetical protein [Bacteroidales bacterium]